MARFLTKECPHCHEDSFGWRPLVTLDYFSPYECKACGKLVRNDGFRQFLVIPTILVTLFVGIVLFASLPDSLEPFGLVLLLVLVALAVLILTNHVKLVSKYDICPLL